MSRFACAGAFRGNDVGGRILRWWAAGSAGKPPLLKAVKNHARAVSPDEGPRKRLNSPLLPTISPALDLFRQNPLAMVNESGPDAAASGRPADGAKRPAGTRPSSAVLDSSGGVVGEYATRPRSGPEHRPLDEGCCVFLHRPGRAAGAVHVQGSGVDWETDATSNGEK